MDSSSHYVCSLVKSLITLFNTAITGKPGILHSEVKAGSLQVKVILSYIGNEEQSRIHDTLSQIFKYYLIPRHFSLLLSWPVKPRGGRERWVCICMNIFLELLLAHKPYVTRIYILAEFFFLTIGLRNCSLPFSVDTETGHKGILSYSCQMVDHQILIVLLCIPGPGRRKSTQRRHGWHHEHSVNSML